MNEGMHEGMPSLTCNKGGQGLGMHNLQILLSFLVEWVQYYNLQCWGWGAGNRVLVGKNT